MSAPQGIAPSSRSKWRHCCSASEGRYPSETRFHVIGIESPWADKIGRACQSDNSELELFFPGIISSEKRSSFLARRRLTPSIAALIPEDVASSFTDGG
jgi:hypothetical protein